MAPSSLPEQALSDMRVLDLTHNLTGPYATKLLADYGADVIKIERPDGDPARTIGPFKGDDPHPEKSLTFFHLNMNKRGITLNLKSPTGKGIFKEMVKTADVVVENFRPHVMSELGLSWDVLKKINPKLVMTSISNFGQSGPYAEYKGTELVMYGMGGPLHSKGKAEREPISLSVPTTVYHGSVVALVGTMGAFYGAKLGGVGQHVDSSIMEGLLGSVDGRIGVLLGYQYSGLNSVREPGSGGFANGIFPCQDGYFVIAASGGRMWPRLMKMMGEPEELMAPSFLTPLGQRNPANRDLFEAVLIGWAIGHTKKEIVKLGEENGLICSALNTMEEVEQDPHFNFRKAFIEVEHPVLGKVKTVGHAIVMNGTPYAFRRPAPLLGQHTAQILGDLGYSKTDLVRLRQTGVI